MKVLDLFSGIGGFSLGLERAGFETVAFCEIEEYPRKVLKKHWPDTPIYEDVRKLDGKQFRGSVELICGGFPCQPFSVAGKQRGKEDDRHLWPEMLRIIKETKPNWVIGENVTGFIKMALDDVLSDLEGEGYTCQTFAIPACAVGGIHRRDRVWIVAHSNEIDNGKQYQHEASSQSNNSETKIHDVSNTTGKSGNGSKPIGEISKSQKPESGNNCVENVTHSEIKGLQRRPVSESYEGIGKKPDDKWFRRCNKVFRGQKGFEPIGIPTESPVRHRDDGLPNNVARLKALGNAVLPQIPEMIGRAIMAIENL